MAVGGELPAHEEAVLLDDGSAPQELWGINLYPAENGDEWIEFDSLINIRPSQHNRSQSVESPSTREAMRKLVDARILNESRT